MNPFDQGTRTPSWLPIAAALAIVALLAVAWGLRDGVIGEEAPGRVVDPAAAQGAVQAPDAAGTVEPTALAGTLVDIAPAVGEDEVARAIVLDDVTGQEVALSVVPATRVLVPIDGHAAIGTVTDLEQGADVHVVLEGDAPAHDGAVVATISMPGTPTGTPERPTATA